MATDKQSILVPKLRFPEFRDASGWEQTSLRDAFKVIANGQANAQDHQEDGAYPLFDRSEVIKRSPTFLFDAQAVILPGEGMSFQPRYFSGKFNLHQRAYALMESELDPRFAFHALDRFKRILANNAVKSTVLSLRMPIIEKFSIPCPTTDNEQQKIADCLGSLDELITATDKKLEALRQHKQGLMQQLFPQPGETVPRLRFPEFEDAGDWKLDKLGNIASITKGKGISKAEITSDGVNPCIRYAELYTSYGEVIEEVVSYTNRLSRLLVLSREEDVIVPASGETRAEIARAACVLIANVALGGDLNILRSELYGPFFSYLLNSPLRHNIAKLAQGDTVAHLYPNQLSQVTLTYPKRPEQQKIANCLRSLDELIAVKSWKLETLQQHKQGLMQQLFPSLNGQ